MQQRKRRGDCFWGMHSDFHTHPNYGVAIGATLKEEDIRRICESAKPEFIQIDCKGHPGYASYPTEMGNAMPEYACDTLEMWRRITKEYGVLLYMHISGVQDVKYCLEHPDEAALAADGKPTNAISLSGKWKYLDELFIPQICELSEKYQIDGVWIDGDCWSVRCDYRPESLKKFEAERGISLNGEVPQKKGDPYFEELLEYTREQYREYLNYYVNALHEKCPELEICANWSFSDHMPEPVCASVDFLSGDLDPFNCVYSSRYAGRMLAMQNMPWDLMSWGFRFNIYGAPLVPPKHPTQLMQEAAAVIALGGAYQNNLLQFADGSPDIERILRDIPLAEFMHARRPYCHGGKIVDQAVMLVPTEDRYKEMTNPFTREGRDKFMGLTALLCDSGESLSIVNENGLREKIGGYPLVILPELYQGLSCEVIEILREYVINGGSLLAVGSLTTKLLSENGFPYHTEAYNAYPYLPGWEFGSTGFMKHEFPEERHPAYLRVADGTDYGVTIGAQTVCADGATVYACLYSSLQDKMGAPTAIIVPYGKGKLGVIGTNLGTQYLEGVQYQHRDLIRNMTRDLYDPMARVESTEGIVEIVCLEVGGKLTVQLVNAGGSHRDMRLSTENYIPPLTNTVISLREDICVQNATLNPEGIPLESYRENGRTYIKIPKVEIHSVITLE